MNDSSAKLKFDESGIDAGAVAGDASAGIFNTIRTIRLEAVDNNGLMRSDTGFGWTDHRALTSLNGMGLTKPKRWNELCVCMPAALKVDTLSWT